MRPLRRPSDSSGEQARSRSPKRNGNRSLHLFGSPHRLLREPADGQNPGKGRVLAMLGYSVACAWLRSRYAPLPGTMPARSVALKRPRLRKERERQGPKHSRQRPPGPQALAGQGSTAKPERLRLAPRQAILTGRQARLTRAICLEKQMQPIGRRLSLRIGLQQRCAFGLLKPTPPPICPEGRDRWTGHGHASSSRRCMAPNVVLG